MTDPFVATLDGWITKVPKRIEVVFKQSVQGVLSIAQQPVAAGGNMPIKDGFLRASLVVDLGDNLPLQTRKPKEGVPYTWNPGELSLSIAGATLDSVITAAWTAEYARLAEYGGPNREARRFRDLAAQQWSSVVASKANELMARAGAL